MQTVDDFREWLESQIDRLASVPSEEWADGDHQDSRQLLGEAYELAIGLRLPQAEIAAQPGPVRVRLCELLESLPTPGYLTREQLAEVLNCSVRTISRRKYQGSLPEPVRIGRLVRYSVKDLREYGIDF